MEEDGVTSPDASEPGITDRRREIDEVLKVFRAAQNAGEGGLESPAPPRQLHHYTTLDGLVGITSTTSLWASDVRYLNDASELAYASDIISEIVAERVTAAGSEILRPVLPERRGFANVFEYGRRPFVACFCEKDDLLSQWRGYRADKTGYSLGFDLGGPAQLPPRTHLRKVVYDADEQKRSVVNVVDVWLRTAESLLLDSSRGLSPEALFPYPAIWALQESLAEHHLRFKHPTFAEEREWRLIKLVDVREELRFLESGRTEEMLRATRERMLAIGVDMPDVSTAWGEANAEGVEIRFRTSSMGLVPYVDLPIVHTADVFTGRLPLRQVIQGPTPNPDLSLESLRMYLEAHGYGFHTDVRASGIPLRQ